jgi:electron transfer flavoprotein alpha subunit
MNKSLIYLDNENIQNSTDLLEVVNQIYGSGNCKTYAISFNQDCTNAEGKFDYIINVKDDRVKNYDIANLTNCMEEVYQNFKFESVIIPATHFGRMLAPRLAMRLNVGLVADVTAIEHVDGVIEMVRPAYGGKIMAVIGNRGLVPLMMSVRQNVFTYVSDSLRKSIKIEFKPENIQPSKIKLLGKREKESSLDIRDSEVLVSGGGGTNRNFKVLYQLAEALNGQVSASRKVVDSGIASRNIQVGQSGKTVSPRLYIALGIHGSLHHIEGLKNVDNIISVNTNKNAPICSLADIVVEGDAIEFIQKLVEKISKNKLNSNY